MSQSDPAPAEPHQEVSLSTPEEQYQQTVKALGKFLGQITPWLFEVGSWIFGGLIAFNLLVLASLVTIGPVDLAVMVATAAFAFSLPLNVTGLVLLRLAQDLKHIRFEEELAQNFQEVGFTLGTQIPTSTTLQAMDEKRTRIILGASLGILALSGLLTLAGMLATMWHMARWIGVGFFAMVILSLVIIILAIVSSQPPASPQEKEQKRRDREEMTRQAKEPDQESEEGE